MNAAYSPARARATNAAAQVVADTPVALICVELVPRLTGRVHLRANVVALAMGRAASAMRVVVRHAGITLHAAPAVTVPAAGRMAILDVEVPRTFAVGMPVELQLVVVAEAQSHVNVPRGGATLEVREVA